MSQAAEKIAQKPRAVQEKYFQLIEFLVHHIHYIPTKELIAISLLLKGKKNLECCVLAVQSLISILKFDNIFKDVFREVGKIALYLYSRPERVFSSDQLGHFFSSQRKYLCNFIFFLGQAQLIAVHVCLNKDVL